MSLLVKGLVVAAGSAALLDFPLIRISHNVKMTGHLVSVSRIKLIAIQ